MKRIVLYCATFRANLPLALCADGGGLPTYGGRLRILTESEFLDHVVDRRAEDRSGNWNISYSDGRLLGEYGGVRLKARWT